MSVPIDNQRPPPDQLLVDIADYVTHPPAFSAEAFDTARYCLMDTLGCGLLALQFPECVKRLGPIVPGAFLPTGARVPGTSYRLDPVHAAFNIGCTIRWLDFNDTWLAAEWGHPSDNLGAILAVADYLCRNGSAKSMHDVLTAMIQAHEIQGVLALKNSFNRVGLDHVVLVKVASTAVVTRLLGGSRQQIIDAVSQAWVDGQSLRTYRHSPNTGPRKSWAAGDAAARAVRLAIMTLRGEMGIPSVLTAPTWGFQDVLFKGKPLVREQPFACYVMENVLFKISFPAEFHAQTAVEAAVRLHAIIAGRRLDEIASIRLWTHESALRIICKDGPLNNPADRDHCLQYMVAVGLLFGDLVAEHYEDAFHRGEPRIDPLRALMKIEEEPSYSRDYLDPQKRSIANAMQIMFKDGSMTERIAVEYPIGHRRRRAQGIPLLVRKFAANLRTCFGEEHSQRIADCCQDADRLAKTPVDQFMDLLAVAP